MFDLKGIYCPIATPFIDDKIAYDKLDENLDFWISSKLEGIVVMGSNGEFVSLRESEKEELIQHCCKRIAGKKRVVVGTGSNCFDETLHLCNFSKECGADAVLLVTPFYYKGSMKDDVLEEYFTAVADRSPLPVILYNIPSTTHNTIELDTVYALSKLPNVAGIKDSSGNFVPFSRGLFGPRSDQFAWIQGEDYLCGSALLCGGDGMVSGLSNARVEPYVEMYQAYEQGDTDKIIECQRRINFLYRVIHSCGNGNAAIKAVTELAGRGARYMRQGSMNLTDEQVAVIAQIMAEYEAL